MTRAGRRYRLTNPRRSGPEAQQLLPRWVSMEMRSIDVEDFLEFDATPEPTTRSR